MLVSVVIPNYNHARFLEQRIISVLNQSYQNIEVIILDDCSTDDSKGVLEQFVHHPKVSEIVYNSVNSGTTFKQWQKGIQLAKGELIWIAESDDWCEPTLLETLVNAITTTSGCTLAYCQSLMVNDSQIVYQSYHSLLLDVIEGKKFINNYLLYRNSIFNASMVVFKRECFFFINPEYLNYRFCGDWVFWAEIARQGNVCISAKVLNYFRKHDKDVSGSAYGSGLSFIEEVRLLRYFRKTSLISEENFLKALRVKYINFFHAKRNFTKAIQKNIQDTFLVEDGTDKIFLRQIHYNIIIKNIVKMFLFSKR